MYSAVSKTSEQNRGGKLKTDNVSFERGAWREAAEADTRLRLSVQGVEQTLSEAKHNSEYGPTSLKAFA